MNLLALETSSHLFSVALSVDGRRIQYENFVAHLSSEQILPVIQQLLLEAGVSLNQLNALVLGMGPGSFTGLRLSSSVIQAFAFVYELPVILLSSLRANAQALFEREGTSHVLVAMNAFQQEVYWGAYQIDEQHLMQSVIPDRLIAPENIKLPASFQWIGTGDAWSIYPQLEGQCVGCLQKILSGYPTAGALLTLGKTAFLQKQFVSAQQALPAYLREEDAWRKKS